MQCCKTAHRYADDVRLGDRETVEHGADVVAGALLRIAGGIFWYIRGRVAAGIVCNAAIAPREVADLRLKATVIVGKLVDKHNRSARPGLFVVETDAVIGGDVWHRAAF